MAEALPLGLEHGNCRELGIDTQIMYPEVGDDRAEMIAKSICEGCVAIVTCRDYAMSHREQGVWGQTTEQERRNLRGKINRYKRNGSRKRQGNL